MDDEKIEAMVTNLEFAENNLDKLLKIIDPQLDPESLIGQTITLIRESLETLRAYEVQKEIERYSKE